MFRGCTMRALHLSAPAARQHANRASHAHAQCTGAAQTARFEFQDFTCSLKIIIETLGRRGRRPELLKTCDHEEAGFTPSLGAGHCPEATSALLLQRPRVYKIMLERTTKDLSMYEAARFLENRAFVAEQRLAEDAG